MRTIAPERLQAREIYIEAAERLPAGERDEALRRLAELDRRWERLPPGVVAAAGVLVGALLAAVVLALLLR